MTRIRHDNAAGEDLIGSGREFTSGAESDRDTVETAGRQIDGSLNGGAGSVQAASLHQQAYQRSDEVVQAAVRTTSTDQKTQDIGQQTMQQVAARFANRG